jgi:hypothetical protein
MRRSELRAGSDKLQIAFPPLGFRHFRCGLREASLNKFARFRIGRTKGSIIRHHTRSESLCSKLVAHLLNLRRLRFEGGSEGLNFRLLVCDGRCLLCSG